MVMKKLFLDSKYGKRTKGFILSLDISIAVFVSFILIAVSVYYVSLANEETLSRIQMVRTGSDILTMMDYKGVLDRLSKAEIQNKMKVLLPPGYQMRMIIRGNFPYERGAADVENLAKTSIKDNDKTWKDDEWVSYYVIFRSGLNNNVQRKIQDNDENTLTVSEFPNKISIGDEYKIISINTIAESSTVSETSEGNKITITDSSKTWEQNEWKGYDIVFLSGDNQGEQRKIESNTPHALTVEVEFPNDINVNDEYEIIFQGGMVAESSTERSVQKFLVGGKRTFIVHHDSEEYFATADFLLWLK